MRRLAFKIFLSFWAVIAVSIASFPLLPVPESVTPPAAPPPPPPFPYLTVGLTIVASGIVCFALAAYLARPLQRVREASRRLAAGDLHARAGPGLGARYDEIGDVVRDFDAMAARLEALLHAQTQLLSDISHELRSPLARINVALELARRRRTGEATRADLDRIEAEIARINELIGRVLALARAETIEVATFTPVDVGAVVRRVTDDADYEAQQMDKSVALHIAVEAIVPGDERLIASAVDNIVRNGMRHTPPRTSVEVSVDGTSEDVVITVRDHGPGVPPGELERIFSPFHRVAVAGDDGEGVGLGLAIAQRSIAVHGGRIRVANASDGGLVVTIVIPREAPTPLTSG